MPPFALLVENALRRQAAPPPPLTPEEIAYTNAPQILSITGAFFTLAALVVLARCYVRIALLKVFGVDDYIMVVAMMIATATFALFKLETNAGLGKHLPVLMADKSGYEMFQKLNYIHSFIIMVGVSLVKISIACFLLRLSTKAWYSRFIYGVIAFIIVMTMACGGTLIFQCVPVSAAWDMALRPPPLGTGNAKCYDLTIFRNLGLMNSSFNILTDALFATIPIPLIWQLQLNMRKKIGLVLILSLGWFACGSAIVKCVKQWTVLTEPDWTVEDSFEVWNYIEFTIGIIAASLPALKPLFNWFFDIARGITSGGRTKASYGQSAYKKAGSLGYLKQSENSSKSIALQSMSSRAEQGPKSPYNVRITTAPTGLADKEAWDMIQAKHSDESILPLQQPEPGHNGILMTREVRVRGETR